MFSRNLETVHDLLENSSDINVQFHGYTPLDLAIHMEQMDIIKLLVQNNAQPHSTKPLHYAVIKNILLLELLLDAGLDPNLTDSTGRTALFAAVGTDNIEAAELLVQYRININLPSEHGCPILIFAIYNNPGMVEWLLDQGCDPNIKTPDGFGPLEIAIIQKNNYLIKLLVKYSAHISGVCPLAIKTGLDHDVIRWLLEQGCEPCIEFVELAIGKKDSELVQLLKEHGGDVLDQKVVDKSVMHNM